MKIKLIHSVLALVLVTFGASTAAHAWTDQVERATIPFDFQAGKQTMPAGTYNIRLNAEDNMVTLVNLSDESAVSLLGVAPSENGGDGSVLIFVQAGGNYFLRELKSNLLDESFPSKHEPAGPSEAVMVPLT